MRQPSAITFRRGSEVMITIPFHEFRPIYRRAEKLAQEKFDPHLQKQEYRVAVRAGIHRGVNIWALGHTIALLPDD